MPGWAPQGVKMPSDHFVSFVSFVVKLISRRNNRDLPRHTRHL